MNVLKRSEKRICSLCQKPQKGWGEDIKGSDLFSGLEFTSYPESSNISAESWAQKHTSLSMKHTSLSILD